MALSINCYCVRPMLEVFPLRSFFAQHIRLRMVLSYVCKRSMGLIIIDVFLLVEDISMLFIEVACHRSSDIFILIY